MIVHQAHNAFTHFRGKLVLKLVLLVHDFILSEVGAFTKPGGIQLRAQADREK